MVRALTANEVRAMFAATDAARDNKVAREFERRETSTGRAKDERKKKEQLRAVRPRES